MDSRPKRSRRISAGPATPKRLSAAAFCAAVILRACSRHVRLVVQTKSPHVVNPVRDRLADDDVHYGCLRCVGPMAWPLRVEVVGACSPVMNRGRRGAGARHGGMRLAKVAGMNDQAAAQAVKRFARTLAEDPKGRRSIVKPSSELSTI